MVFRRELPLPCDLMFGAPPDKEQLTTVYTAALVERLHNIHHFAHQHLKVASDQMKAHYDQLANSAGFQVGDVVAVLPYPKEGKIAQVADVLGRPLPHHYPDQRCHIPDSAPFQGKNDCRPPRQTDAIPGDYSGQVVASQTLAERRCRSCGMPMVECARYARY